ncbi:adenylyl-sulfate kinase [Selenihalanaerobacter shriftii]|uniref:Adenylyl-sulfate kinase n=1 Tax=Selenihalanaerobacter shriftii TaxID=142842 RepID=A0A1T4JUS2_9FIRM|nr:adenylyl-sulfate kinase [Selenihalanaerobacter shriftii]SJZ33972.1 bifunctional enzyme CysN/CysC [Selenihalanaerobacter shriftii]
MAKVLERQKEDLSIVIAGHVDHGKSTIIGRLLADTDSLPEGKLQQVKETCRRNSKPFEYAFLLDALKDEQSQGITIDSARCFFETDKRRYIIIDAPGHIEFLKNMVTGAARAEASLLVIDADEGVRENSRRHGYMLSMLGIKQVAVLINKMDLVGYNQQIFQEIVEEYTEFLHQINIKPISFIPVSGMRGDNIANLSKRTKWYQGETILEVLDSFNGEKLPGDKPFRMPIQDIYKFTKGGDDRRIIAGTIESGQIKIGDEIVFYPSGKRGKVKSIEAFNEDPKESVSVGYATGFTLEEQIYITRGEVATLAGQSRPQATSRIKVNLFWLGKNSMKKQKDYYLKLGTTKVKAKIEKVVRVIDASKLSQNEDKNEIERHDVAECILKLEKAIAFDLINEIAETSRFVIIDNYEIAGGGIIQNALEDEENWVSENNIIWHEGEVTYEDRCRNIGQQGLVVWFTGLSGSGKSTIAVEVEKELIKQGKVLYRLDGDNIRYGLNSDLGFIKEDRDENIRRITEVATLFKDAGLITLASFISPFKSMRDFAKKKIGEENFIEIYVKANIEVCVKRDPKGLYEKAKQGEIENFTGISSPYEEPEDPDVVIDTEELTVAESVEKVLKLVDSLQITVDSETQKRHPN